MVVFDPYSVTCNLYEIKHSSERIPEQYWNLNDPQKCAEAQKQFGDITGKYVLYRGDEAQENNVAYFNVEKYLCGLTHSPAHRQSRIAMRQGDKH